MARMKWRGRGLAAAGAVLVAGCSGGPASREGADGARAQGLVEVRAVTYTSSVDGSRVSGLAAIPRAAASRGCVIWQFGFRSRKEDSSWAWQGLAALGLTTFSIDFRSHGARASSPTEYQEVLRKPAKFASLVRDTVGDLRSAVDHLERQPYCAGHVAYGGVSLGGAIGAMLAAGDKRVQAVVLVVTPGSWGAVVRTPGTPLLPGVSRRSAELAAALRVYAPLDPARFVGRIAPRPVLILSGRTDKTVTISNARTLQAAAREPKRIVEFRGGHNPALGPDATANADEIASFLLHNVVEPTYGISGGADGTFIIRP